MAHCTNTTDICQLLRRALALLNCQIYFFKKYFFHLRPIPINSYPLPSWSTQSNSACSRWHRPLFDSAALVVVDGLAVRLSGPLPAASLFVSSLTHARQLPLGRHRNHFPHQPSPHLSKSIPNASLPCQLTTLPSYSSHSYHFISFHRFYPLALAAHIFIQYPPPPVHFFCAVFILSHRHSPSLLTPS